MAGAAPAPRPRADRRTRVPQLALLGALALASSACGGARGAADASHPTGASRRPGTAAASASTRARTAVHASSGSGGIRAPVSTAVAQPAGALPQTDQLPAADTATFHREMVALWQGIVGDDPGRAAAAFFPEAAYLQVKDIPDPAADYADRLVADFRLDVAAASAHLGPHRVADRLIGVTVPADEAAWIPPGYCANRIGYWHDPGARLVYSAGGHVRSIGIASLISWRGVWYVVHLGAVLRSSAVGIVDDPANGPGEPAPPGGC